MLGAPDDDIQPFICSNSTIDSHSKSGHCSRDSPPLLYERLKQNGKELTLRCELGNIKSTTFPKQSSLKVRIKVGPDPKVALDDVHLVNRQFLTDPVHSVISCSQIIQMMTSFPVPGEQPLSPLSDDLFQLTEKEILLNGGKSLATRDRSNYLKDDRKLIGKKNSNDSRACEVMWEDPASNLEEGCGGNHKAACENGSGSFQQCALVLGNHDDLMILKGRKSHNSHVKELPRKKGSLCCKSLEDRLRDKHSKVPKEALVMVPSYSLNNGSNFEAKRKMKEVKKAQEKHEKIEDRYRDFFGDIELEDEDDDDENCTSPLKGHNAGQMKEADTVDKCSRVKTGMQKEKSSGKKISKVPLPKSDPHAAAVHCTAAQSGNAHVSSIGVPATDAAALIKENWVCCDKCEKWRLLPLGLNPESLPEKWLCIMLDWLPGMNRCSASEEETTNAVNALIQVPIKVHPDNGVATVSHDKSSQKLAPCVMTAGGKMKHGFGVPSNTFKHNKKQFLNTEKKSRLAVADNGSSDAHAQSCTLGKSETIKWRRADNGMAGAMFEPKPNEELRVDTNSSDGGNAKRLMLKGKRELDQHCHRTTKKIRTEALQEDMMPRCDEIMESNIQKNHIARSEERVKGSSSNDKHACTETCNDVGAKKKRKSPEGPTSGHEMGSATMSKILSSHINKGNFCVSKPSPVESILQKHSYSAIDGENVPKEKKKKKKAESAENNKARNGVANDQEGAAQDHLCRPPLELNKVNEGDATGHPNGILHCSSKDDAHTVRRDPSRQFAMSVIKEATNLKHMADRLKNSGLDSESINLYFEAALKFLHGACLLESCCSRISKVGEMVQSMQIYSSTAKLCEFCAHEYEKNKYMGSAALAYKCMEVAYMRVVFMSHVRANGDQSELKMVLGIVPTDGSSTSSSASDIDNLNHSTTMEKALLAKQNNSSKVSMIRPMTGKHRASCLRLLEFARDVDSAVEASRKSQFAFCAANTSLGDGQNREAVSSVKTAIDFNFQDVQAFVRLVRLAVEALGN